MSEAEIKKLDERLTQVQSELIEVSTRSNGHRTSSPADYRSILVTTGIVMFTGAALSLLGVISIVLFVLYLDAEKRYEEVQRERVTEVKLLQYDYQSVREKYGMIQGIIEGEHGRKLDALPESQFFKYQENKENSRKETNK